MSDTSGDIFLVLYHGGTKYGWSKQHFERNKKAQSQLDFVENCWVKKEMHWAMEMKSVTISLGAKEITQCQDSISSYINQNKLDSSG